MRFGFHKAALLIGAAAIMMPAAAAAQEVQTVQGEINSAPRTFNASVPANSVMVIDVISTSDLDPVVAVTNAATGEMIAENDDGGEGFNSRVRIPGGERGVNIVIEVNSFDAAFAMEGEQFGGTFDLVMTTSEFSAPGPITYGSTVMGTVPSGESVDYSFTARAGDMIEVALLSEGELDPYLELRDPSGEAIMYDDDGGEGLNSLLRYTFGEAGTYTVAAMGFMSSAGDYTLRVRERREAPEPQLPLQVIGFNDTATGELGVPWEENAMLPGTIDYMLSEDAKRAIRRGNGHITIRMNAVDGAEYDPAFGGGAIDPFIEVGFETPLGWASVLSDDDGSGTLDSLLPIDLSVLDDHPGMLDMLRIRVQGFGGSSGAYTLTITEGLAERFTWDTEEAAAEAVGW